MSPRVLRVDGGPGEGALLGRLEIYRDAGRGTRDEEQGRAERDEGRDCAVSSLVPLRSSLTYFTACPRTCTGLASRSTGYSRPDASARSKTFHVASPSSLCGSRSSSASRPSG